MDRTFKTYCLLCGSNSCLHLQKSHADMLTPRELDVIRVIVDPRYAGAKDMAFSLNISVHTIKVYLARIYLKVFQSSGGSVRLLALWAFAHREALGIPCPTLADYARPEAA